MGWSGSVELMRREAQVFSTFLFYRFVEFDIHAAFIAQALMTSKAELPYENNAINIYSLRLKYFKVTLSWMLDPIEKMQTR